MAGRRQECDEDEDYVGPSQSQPSQLTEEKRRNDAGILCNYLLAANSKQVPAKRADISKAVLKDAGRHFGVILEEARQMLREVYGYEVIELEKKGQFILVNKETHMDGGISGGMSSQRVAKLGLLTPILAAIFMSGGTMQEDDMKAFLMEYGIDMERKDPHPVFGDINHLLHSELVQERFLEASHDKDRDPPSRVYKWGSKADHLVSKKTILEYVCQVYGDDMKPEDWPDQWKEIQRLEKQRNT